MKASTRKIKNYKIQTLVYSHVFIFSVQVIVFLMSRPPIIVMIISWAISALGATVIILFAFQRIESIQIKLDQHLIRSRQFSQRQTALASLSGIFATLQSVDQICEELAKRLHDIQGFDYVSVYLLNKHTPDRILRAYAGDDDLPNPLTIQPGIGLSEQPILDGKLQYIPDVTENPKYSSGYGKGAEIDIPIQYHDKILGVLVVESPQTNAFGPFDFSMLTTAADQAAIAIQNTRLLEAEQKRRHEAELLRIASIAVSSNLELDQVLDRILIQLEQVVPYDSACVFLLKGKYVHAKAARGLPSPEKALGLHFPANNELLQLVAKTGHPVMSGNIREDARFEGWGGTQEMCSWMGVPLTTSGEIIGFLTLDSRTFDSYDLEQAGFAEIFANQAAVALQNARLYQSAKDSAERLLILHEASQNITSSSFNLEETYVTIHRAAAQLMPCEAFSISILDEENDEIEAVYLIDRSGRAPAVRISSDRGLSGHIISTGEALLVHDFSESQKMQTIDVMRFGDKDHIRAFIAVPMKLGNKIVGMLSAQSYQTHEYTSEDQKMLEMLAAHAAIALGNAQLFAQIQHLAITDSLTDVHNRRHFFEIAQREFVRAKRYNSPLSLIMLDLDRYKLVNDTYGHIVGDQVLKEISQNIQDSMRESDTLGRYGGDEFSILLPETDLDHAVEFAERLRETICNLEFSFDNKKFKTSLSMGVASTNAELTQLPQLLLSADIALYNAKNQGRNRVCSATWPIEDSVDIQREWSDPC